MTCKELIKRLKDFPPEMAVRMRVPTDQLFPTPGGYLLLTVKGADIALGRNSVMIHDIEAPE